MSKPNKIETAFKAKLPGKRIVLPPIQGAYLYLRSAALAHETFNTFRSPSNESSNFLRSSNLGEDNLTAKIAQIDSRINKVGSLVSRIGKTNSQKKFCVFNEDWKPISQLREDDGRGAGEMAARSRYNSPDDVFLMRKRENSNYFGTIHKEINPILVMKN